MWYIRGSVAPLGRGCAGRSSASGHVLGRYTERVSGTGRHGDALDAPATRTTHRGRRLRHPPVVVGQRRPVFDDVTTDGHVTQRWRLVT